MNLSKSRYTKGITCPKKLWLSCFKPEEEDNSGNQAIFDNGNMVGELARGLFGEYVLIDYDLGFDKMIEETKKELNNKPNIICEASFNYDGNFCAVDILKNDNDGVEIYEVKSSTNIDEIYIDDISYQTWVLKKCGMNVKKCSIVYINNQYIKNGELDIYEYFNIEDVTKLIDLDSVEDNIIELKKVINNNKEPNILLNTSCHFNREDCPFFRYCTRKLPKPNVFDIGWRTSFNKKLEMYDRGNITLDDVLNNESLNDKALVQVKYLLNDLDPYIDKDSIKEFLSNIRYPLYFLDFESYQDAIPKIDGTWPYQQICFQYSLHYYLEENGELYHKEFLSDDYDGNPMYGLCKQLCEDIPLDSCVIVYNKGFECERLEEMANLFPEFSSHLLNISNNIVDLVIPFMNQYYYVREIGSSWSIKKVLPALYPDDPNLNYHNLDQVHKGDEASNAYLSLKNLSKEEQDKLRKNMLIYCGLDTYATVKLYEKFKSVLD